MQNVSIKYLDEYNLCIQVCSFNYYTQVREYSTIDVQT